MDVIAYPCWDQSWTMSDKGDPGVILSLQQRDHVGLVENLCQFNENLFKIINNQDN